MIPEAILSLALFSLADLRYREVPGAAVFFLASVLVTAPADPIRVGLVVLSVGWGWLRWPSLWILPAFFLPSTWAVLLTGAGVRQGIVGEADLLTLGGMACLFDWPATMLVLAGVETWRWMWRQKSANSVPALPGMLMGFSVYLLWKLKF
jgi:hypothetical protein